MLIFQVARNKHDREQMIATSLEDITSWLGDLHDYQDIYRNDLSLKPYILEVYTLIIYFAIETWQYWRRSTICKCWYSTNSVETLMAIQPESGDQLPVIPKIALRNPLITSRAHLTGFFSKPPNCFINRARTFTSKMTPSMEK